MPASPRTTSVALRPPRAAATRRPSARRSRRRPSRSGDPARAPAVSPPAAGRRAVTGGSSPFSSSAYPFRAPARSRALLPVGALAAAQPVRELGPRGDADLAVDLAQVVLDGADAEDQAVADLAVG